MPRNKCFWCKISTLSIVGILVAVLFWASLTIDYHWELTREHVRFRSGFPSQANWITSPYGTLNCYLFNVTNADAFLNGTDTKLMVQEIGPIVYRIKGRNEIINQTDSFVTYRKIRYDEIEFDPEASTAPDVLNQTIVMPNFVLLGGASKLHDWLSWVRPAFNAITINEPVFLSETVNYFLWDFKRPALDLLSNYMPNVVSNCGMLYNALRTKEEVYNVQIGTENGVENFFRVNTLNNKTYFPEQSDRLKILKNKKSLYCPIEVLNTFDNSLFPPLVKIDSKMSIVAAESCRTLQLTYNGTLKHLGFSGHRFVISDPIDTTHCLDTAMGIKLHKGMFDVSKCLFNEVPSAFSSPHFYGSSYNWSEHFEGLSPKAENHEPFIIVEPITGIPIEEHYRFQSNMPMPDMTGYNKDLQRFSHMVLPTFWYEYDLDDLPLIVQILMRLQVFVFPEVQPIIMALLIIGAFSCALKIFLLFKGIKLKHVLCKFCQAHKNILN